MFGKLAMSLSGVKSKYALPARFKDCTYSVWVEFVDLVAKYKPLNLGQGFPDYDACEYIPSTLATVAADKNNLLHQYTRGFGHPRLVNILGKMYSKLINREINPMTEILITCGAYEAIYSAIAGHVDVGDEVIIIEPFYDCYEPIVRIFNGVPRFISLKNTKAGSSGDVYSSDWKLDPDELSSLFNSKTKLIILNTPHNPSGKVFTVDELQMIADLCKKHNVVCISDEVYEWLVYKPNVHVRIATLPGMWERTLTIGSVGKTLSVTGWKCGWLYGPDYLMKNATIAHQNNIYTYNTPIQEAVALCFEKEFNNIDNNTAYFQRMSASLQPKRDYFMNVLKKIGFKPTIPEAGYFVMADWSNLAKHADLSAEPDSAKDYKFSKWMTKNVKLLGIPPSAFYSKEHKTLAEDYIRFCFFKQEKTLENADNILTTWKNSCKL